MRYLLLTIRPILADLAGTFTFYLVFLATGSPRIGAAVGLALGVAQLAWHRAHRRSPPALLLVAVMMTIVLGGVTIATDDARFLLIKPAIVYTAVGATMLRRGWVVRYLPTIAHDLLPRLTIDRVGWSWAALLFATALANLALVALLPPRAAAGIFFVGALASKLLLFAVQFRVLRARAGRAHARLTAAVPPAAAPGGAAWRE